MGAMRTPGADKPVVGLLDDIEQAQLDRVHPDEVSQMLISLRRGETGAHAEFVKGFRCLVYEKAGHGTGHFRQDRLGLLFLGLDRAISRLAKNSESNPEKFIRDELTRSLKDYRREESPNNLPPPSTLSNQRKNGRVPYKPLRSIKNASQLHAVGYEESDDHLWQSNRLQNPEAQWPIADQTGKEIDNPDTPFKRNIAISVEETDLRCDLTQNEQERDILDLLLLGHKPVHIAATTGTTVYRVQNVISLLATRAERLGYGDFQSYSRQSA